MSNGIAAIAICRSRISAKHPFTTIGRKLFHECFSRYEDADLVILGSYFPDGIAAADLLAEKARCPVMFYDIDTPITLAALRAHGTAEYLEARQIPAFDAYLSFTGGPLLEELQTRFGAKRAIPFYCSVDPDRHFRYAARAKS